ncbi:TetR/AcrR family transcriptional regulator [Kribbella jiaozuonensis]|uniref:TetR/AcrR family transcriptional regulator n=1 Tax=Kribbella jiaozuonensis TaxID=2575441 RepID=A0A4U3LJR5_9ACTN|nr:TetR/AcrR family transcriptional regulator [Kribbella jiaozuonensis]TKK74546.1 TetR/AcrR family transcriptional regulator [Kribbella jiaozuonensis]
MATPNPERRSERARQAILDAALELCLKHTYGGLTMEGIAKRAGVGKQTIYRWWPSKAAILLEALQERGGSTLIFPDTGNLKADLRAQMNQVVTAFTDPTFAAYSGGLIAAAQSDPDIAAAVVASIIKPRVDLCVERLQKAQQAGELRPDVNLPDLVELLYAPLYYRLLLHTRPVSKSQVTTILDLALNGATADKN